jgi:hypothetical protein
MRRVFENVTQTGSDYINSVLGTNWATTIDRWLREVVDAKATVVSRAMDAEYLRTHIGGGFHRLFDGGHDLWGAFKATRSVTPDDALLTQLGKYVTELGKDLATPNGLPVITWNKEIFDATSKTLQQYLGVSPSWVYDMATFTATELGGAAAAILALAVNLRSSDPDRYAEMCGSLGIASLVSANPLLLAIWVTSILNLVHQRKFRIRWRDSFAILQGVAVSATILISIVGLGVLGLVIAIPLAMLVRRGLKRLALGWRRQIARGALGIIRTEMTAQLVGPPNRLLLSGPQPTAV